MQPARRIRAAVPDDARAIAEVHVRSWQVAYRGQLPDHLLDGLSVDSRETAWRQILESPDRNFVVEQDGSVVGFASIGRCRDTGAGPAVGELYAIYVEPGAWGGGIGTALMAHAVDELRRDGYTDASLWVLESNNRARRFYEANGWRADGAAKTEQMGIAQVREVRYARPL
jgi:GNAT superfamily N-acetyltransferase